MTKTWFITGAGRGFGRQFAAAALERGDNVAATARDTATLQDLEAQYGSAILPLQLDVTDRDGVYTAIARTTETFGSLDIVVNNAGYGLFGTIEEITEEQLRAQLEVNFFGAFHVTQAALPVMQAQRSGHIIQISSIAGVAAFPVVGGYHASKWALEGLSESLAQEVAGFGINVTIVEPGGFKTDWGGSSAVHAAGKPQYDDVKAAFFALQSSIPQPEPDNVGAALLTLVDAPQPPLRVFFGTQPIEWVANLFAERLTTWNTWEHVARQAEGL